MDGSIFGTQILPDQMQVVNPAIVLILIPIFDRVLYPFLNKIHVLKCPLHRMAIGGLIAGTAFLSAGILELILEDTYPELPENNRAAFNLINTLPCGLIVTSPFVKAQKLAAGEMYRFKDIVAYNDTEYEIIVQAPLNCGKDLILNGHQFKLKILTMEHQVTV